MLIQTPTQTQKKPRGVMSFKQFIALLRMLRGHEAEGRCSEVEKSFANRFKITYKTSLDSSYA